MHLPPPSHLHHKGTYGQAGVLVVALLCAVASGCVAGPSLRGDATTPSAEGPSASDAEWRALATPRPTPLAGAPRVAVGGVDILLRQTWALTSGVDPAQAVAELAAAGLLLRRDVRYVERRRFVAAADAERHGAPRPRGAPAAGISPEAQFVASATWIRAGSDSAYLELRVADAGTGVMVTTRRTATSAEADPIDLARVLVASLVAALEGDDLLPEENRTRQRAPAPPRAGIPAVALEAFLRGLGAEERWAWETARRGYQEALSEAPDFVEARAALARLARLRTGGTLGEGGE